MTEQNDIFEDLFREGLQEMEIPVTENLWKRIKRSITEKKRRGFFWLFFGLCVMAGGILFLIFGEKNSGKETREIRPISQIAQKEKQIVLPDSEKIPSQKDSLSSLGQTMPLDVTAEKKKEVPLYANQFPQNEAGKTESKTVKKVNANETSKEFLQTTEKIKNIQGQTKNTEKTSENKANKTKQVTGKKENAPKDEEKTTTFKSSWLDNNTGNQNKTDSSIAKQEEKKSETLAGELKKNKNETAKIDSTVQSAAQAPSTDSLKKEIKDSVAVKTTDSIPGVKKQDTIPEPKIKMILGLEAGIVSPLIKYTDKYFNGIFKNKPGFDAIRYTGISIKDKLNITLGVGVYTMNTNVSIDDYQGTYKDTVKLTKIDSSGNPYLVDTLVTKTKTGRWNGKYRYLYLAIPLIFEYTFNIGKKMRITPGIGVIFNQSIRSPFPNYSDFSITPDFSLKAGYMLNKKWQLYLTSHYSYFRKPTYVQYTREWDDPPTILPAYFNVNFGVRYSFGNKW